MSEAVEAAVRRLDFSYGSAGIDAVARK